MERETDRDVTGRSGRCVDDCGRGTRGTVCEALRRAAIFVRGFIFWRIGILYVRMGRRGMVPPRGDSDQRPMVAGGAPLAVHDDTTRRCFGAGRAARGI